LLFLFIGIGQRGADLQSFLVCAQELTFYDELCADSRWVHNAAQGALMMPCAACGTNTFSTMEKCTLINDTAGVKFVHGMSAPVVRRPPAPPTCSIQSIADRCGLCTQAIIGQMYSCCNPACPLVIKKAAKKHVRALLCCLLSSRRLSSASDLLGISCRWTSPRTRGLLRFRSRSSSRSCTRRPPKSSSTCSRSKLCLASAFALVV